MLKITGLKKTFTTGFINKRSVKAVDGMDFCINDHETFGLVGESGCGKTTVGRLILRLIEPTDGQVIFNGIDLLKLDKKALRKIRPQLQIIFQDPESSLHPRMRIGDSIAEPLKLYDIVSKERRDGKVRELIDKVGLNPEHINRYPHELSGGQSQRAMLARVLALAPKLIIADEPTSSLDVSVQAQILSLLKDAQKEFGFSCLFISHDLNIIRNMTQRMGVMYLGKLVEIGSTADIFKNARHPYTKALLSAIPLADPLAKRKRIILKEEMPNHMELPTGCRFHTRCNFKDKICETEAPTMVNVGNDHQVACHFPQLASIN
jgi:peptide/nickel transport system ATP-binding protein/oligopeptide transport system ATP-binding protein